MYHSVCFGSGSALAGWVMLSVAADGYQPYLRLINLTKEVKRYDWTLRPNSSPPFGAPASPLADKQQPASASSAPKPGIFQCDQSWLACSLCSYLVRTAHRSLELEFTVKGLQSELYKPHTVHCIVCGLYECRQCIVDGAWYTNCCCYG